MTDERTSPALLSGEVTTPPVVTSPTDPAVELDLPTTPDPNYYVELVAA